MLSDVTARDLYLYRGVYDIYTVKPPKTSPWTFIFQKRVKKEILKS